MPVYELEVEPKKKDKNEKDKNEKELAKIRLEYLLTDYVLPRDIKQRQKIYTEIGILLEKVQ